MTGFVLDVTELMNVMGTSERLAEEQPHPEIDE